MDATNKESEIRNQESGLAYRDLNPHSTFTPTVVAHAEGGQDTVNLDQDVDIHKDDLPHHQPEHLIKHSAAEEIHNQHQADAASVEQLFAEGQSAANPAQAEVSIQSLPRQALKIEQAPQATNNVVDLNAWKESRPSHEVTQTQQTSPEVTATPEVTAETIAPRQPVDVIPSAATTAEPVAPIQIAETVLDPAKATSAEASISQDHHSADMANDMVRKRKADQEKLGLAA